MHAEQIVQYGYQFLRNFTGSGQLPEFQKQQVHLLLQRFVDTGIALHHNILTGQAMDEESPCCRGIIEQRGIEATIPRCSMRISNVDFIGWNDRRWVRCGAAGLEYLQLLPAVQRTTPAFFHGLCCSMQLPGTIMICGTFRDKIPSAGQWPSQDSSYGT